MIEVEGPDGVVLEFPDGTPRDTIRAAMAKRYGGPRRDAAPKRTWMDDVAGGLAQLNSQIPLADEFAGAADTAVNLFRGRESLSDLPAAYGRSMARIRDQEAGFQGARPKVAALARGTGQAVGVAIPAGKTANLFAESPRIVNAARGAVTAGLTAAGYAATDRGTGEERLRAAAEAAMNPAVLGLGAAGGAMAPAARKPRTTKRPPVDVEDLRATKTAAYRAADQAGARYNAEGFGQMVGAIEREAAAGRINPMRHAKAASMLEDMRAMRDAGTAPTLTELDQLRQVIRRDVANARDDGEAYFGRLMIDELDKFIDTAGARQMATGSAEEAAGLIAAARDANTRFRKVEAVTDAVDRARLRAGSTGSGGNVDNAIRQNLRGVLEKSRNLTDAERAALESIVVGDRGQNLLRQIGKLSPQGNGLMLAGHLVAAVPTGGASTLVAAAGAASKVAADRMTQQKVQQLLQLMADGGTPQVRAQALAEFSDLAARDPAVAQLQKELAARLSRAAGIAARPKSAVTAEVEGRPDLGVGYSTENLFARP